MAPAPRNLINLKDVAKGYGSRTVLEAITLGVAAGERIGIVGRNGDGKSTLLRLMAGVESPDAGAVTSTRDLTLALVDQRDLLDDRASLGSVLLGERGEEHERGEQRGERGEQHSERGEQRGRDEPAWTRNRAMRAVLDGLLGGVSLQRFPAGTDTRIGALSGGERRRVALARELLRSPELLLLDEPTNHLDVDGISWLAGHLAANRGGLLVVTHDRWFLDAVCTATWEVSDGAVHRYDGGYAAYVLARAERERQAAVRESRRQQLVRKELAWLRRGPPARTAKPKFRIEAASALIADEPEPRDRAELLRFAGARLGNKVLELVDVSLHLGERQVLEKVTWRLGPGDRVAIVGANGSGKTSVLRLLAGELGPDSGHVERGATVRLAHLSQEVRELPEDLRVIESLEQLSSRTTLSDGRQLTATILCDRFGFRGEKARTPIGELSGGERRRLALMHLMMDGPNVLLLDEPTNDLDIETLTALEDLLDLWPGTLVAVSHDRYFVERVCDDTYALSASGELRHLPGGIDQYLQQVSAVSPEASGEIAESTAETNLPPGAAIRAARKQTRQDERELRLLEREIERLLTRERETEEQMAASATDHTLLAELYGELEQARDLRIELEARWLGLSESLEERA